MEQTSNSTSIAVDQATIEAAAAAKRAEEEQLRQRYRNLKGQLSTCSASLANLVNAVNALYSSMKTNINIDGKTIQEENLITIKNNSIAIKSNIDGIIGSISGKC